METFDDLMNAVLEILPNAQLDQDLDGQIIIYTNKTTGENGTIKELPDDYNG